MDSPNTPQKPVQYPPVAPQYPATQPAASAPVATMPEEPVGGLMKAFAWPEKLGFAALVLSFVIRIESYKTVNGEILHYSNPTATIGGIVAIVCGLFSLLFLGSTVPNGKSKRLIAAVLLFGLGGYQLAAGQGVFVEGKSGNSSAINTRSHSRNALDEHREMDARYRRDKAARSEVVQTQINQCVKHDDTLACERARKASIGVCKLLPSACGDLGFLFQNGLGGPLDNEKAVTLFRQACTGQNLNACANLGIAHRDGLGVPQNKERALEIFESNCTKGYGRACHLIALLRKETNNLVGAREAFVTSCQAEMVSPTGCAFAFDYFRNGVGGSKDVPGALTWGAIACSNGVADVCNTMGVILYQGVDIPEDPRAQEYFRLACDGDDGQGCANYGKTLLSSQNSTSAFKAFKRGCALDFGESCYREAQMVLDKSFSEPDPELAGLLAAKACKLGFEQACTLRTTPQ